MPNTPLKKICGITSLDDAEMVASYFPDFLGFIFHTPSPRNISPAVFADISDTLRVCFGEGCPQLVGVFVDPKLETVQSIAQYLDVIQLHGDETPEFCEMLKKEFPKHLIWKALKIETPENIEKISAYPMCDGVLLDAFCPEAEGGTGKRIPKEFFAHIAAAKAKQKNDTPDQILLMAGGITAENYLSVLSKTQADGVDLSSSLEKNPGKKSGKKIKRFFCGE